jgi:hypothetical protein
LLPRSANELIGSSDDAAPSSEKLPDSNLEGIADDAPNPEARSREAGRYPAVDVRFQGGEQTSIGRCKMSDDDPNRALACASLRF